MGMGCCFASISTLPSEEDEDEEGEDEEEAPSFGVPARAVFLPLERWLLGR
jgi:hypothetical protein